MQYVIERVHEIVPSLYHFWARPVGQPISYLAGQYVTVSADGQQLTLSVANAPRSDNLLSFIVRTKSFHPIEGAHLVISNPNGHMIAKPGKKIFIAGGTGIAPLNALIESDSNAKLIWSVRDKSEFAMALPQTADTVLLNDAEHGFLGQNLDRLLTAEHLDATWYVAGPLPMCHEVLAHYKKLGGKPSNFFSDMITT